MSQMLENVFNFWKSNNFCRKVFHANEYVSALCTEWTLLFPIASNFEIEQYASNAHQACGMCPHPLFKMLNEQMSQTHKVEIKEQWLKLWKRLNEWFET